MLTLFRLLGLLWLLETAPDKPEDEEEEPEEDSDEPDDDADKIRDAEKQALSREAGKWRKRFREAEARIAELQQERANSEVVAALRDARLETAFLRAVLERGELLDLDTAWDLARIRGFLDPVTVSDAGEVEGMPDALDKVLGRYPWLTEDPLAGEDPDRDARRRSASPPTRKRGRAEPSRDALQDKFPALRKHR